MRCVRFPALFVAVSLFVGTIASPLRSEEPGSIEVQPSDPKLAKIVLIAGSNVFKPGEHEYVAGCAVLRDLLQQTPGVFPVLALDWPKKPETLTGAKSVVFLFDGGDKHQLLGADRMAQVRKLADEGVGFVGLHQFVDVPKGLGDRMRELMGAAWEKGHSQRAHWVHKFATFAEHPVSRGVTPFEIDDGYLFKLRFVPELHGVTPLLRSVSPKAASQELTDDAIVAWLYERANGGRSFTFTGTHLHVSLAEEGYRRFLVNSILWTARVEVPKTGAAVSLSSEALNQYLKIAPAASKSK